MCRAREAKEQITMERHQKENEKKTKDRDLSSPHKDSKPGNGGNNREQVGTAQEQHVC